MAFLDIVQRLLKNSPTSDSRAQRAEELRQRLSENPNDVMAFEELAQIVRDAEENKEARRSSNGGCDGNYRCYGGSGDVGPSGGNRSFS